jgi:hypothetical protein
LRRIVLTPPNVKEMSRCSRSWNISDGCISENHTRPLRLTLMVEHWNPWFHHIISQVAYIETSLWLSAQTRHALRQLSGDVSLFYLSDAHPN